MKKIKDLREKFEKEGFVEYLDQGLLEGAELPTLKFVKSTTMRKETKDGNSKKIENLL